MNKLTERFWQGYWPFYLLIPFSWLYRCFMLVRRFCYRFGVLKVSALPVPVIVVGNICIGGTGKTPFVIALTEALQERGVKVGIVSRGFGGQYNGLPTSVNPQSNPASVGDEPVLIAQKTGAPVVVGHDRVAAGQYLLNEVRCDVLISDDGLQHYSLKRDMGIVLHHPNRLGNKQCLPAGPLREPLSRLADFKHVLIWGQDYYFEVGVPKILKGEPVLLDCKQPIHAVTGISHPERFFSTLRSIGFSNQYTHVFPDHFQFAKADLMFDDNLPLVMTEKDGVKCSCFDLKRMYVLPIQGKIETKRLDVLLDVIQNKLKGSEENE